MTLKMVSVSVQCLFYQPIDEKIKTWTLRFPAKGNPNMVKVLFDWPIVSLCCVVLRARSFLCRAFTKPTKSHACLCPFDKPIKSLSYRTLVVSVLFARFHFIVIRKSLYLLDTILYTG